MSSGQRESNSHKCDPAHKTGRALMTIQTLRHATAPSETTAQNTGIVRFESRNLKTLPGRTALLAEVALGIADLAVIQLGVVDRRLPFDLGGVSMSCYALFDTAGCPRTQNDADINNGVSACCSQCLARRCSGAW